MSKTIEVPDAIYDDVREDAKAHGLSLVGWIASKLPSGRFGAPVVAAQLPWSMAERLAGRLGRIGSGTGEPSSDSMARSFGEYLEAKQRNGTL